MTPIELFAALGSGAMVAGAKFLWDLRNDARAALRILTGEDAIEDDRGLVAEVSELKQRMSRVEEIVLDADAPQSD